MSKENRNSVSSFVISEESEAVPSLMPRELPSGEGLGRSNILAEGVPDLCLHLSSPQPPPPPFYVPETTR